LQFSRTENCKIPSHTFLTRRRRYKNVIKHFYQELVLYYFLIEMFDFYQKEQR